MPVVQILTQERSAIVKKAKQYEFLKKHLETEQDSRQFAFVFDGISSTGYTDMKC